MTNLSRRGFFAGSAGLAAAGLIAPRASAPAAAAMTAPGGALLPADRIGIQLYSLADQVSSIGFEKVLAEVAAMGFTLVEFAGYTDSSSPAITPKQIRALLDANGLKAIGSHVSPSDDETMKKIIEDAATIGIPNVGISLPLPTQGPTVAGWSALSAEYNRYGEMAAKQGIGFYLHNHFHEWFPTPDDPTKRGEDVMLAETDPRYVFFEMDIYWSYVGQWQSGQIQQFDPLHDYAIKYRDRYKLFHVKDGRKDPAGGYTDAINNIVDAGQGSIDFQDFFTTLFAQSLDEVSKHHYIWERDNADSHPRGSLASARASAAYIRHALPGPKAPGKPVPANVPAAVTDVVFKRTRTGRRVLRATIETDATVTTTLDVRRGRRLLVRKSAGELAPGRHVIELRLPSKATAGRARLDVAFDIIGGPSHTARLPVVVPKRG